MLIAVLTTDLVLKHEAPMYLKVLLLFLLMCIVFVYTTNGRWFSSMFYLATLPIQRFNWQSEQFLGNPIFRIASLVLSSFTIAIFVCTYELTPPDFIFLDNIAIFTSVLVAAIVLFLIKYAGNLFYFGMHEESNLGSRVVDFQSSINQLFSLVISGLILVDIFYLRLSGDLFHIVLIGIAIYFLIRLYGTIVILQSNFKHSFLAVFVYLCTYEIVPALVFAKILFVNS